MTKPVITTRAGKGSALTWTEGDTNLTNLRDATVAIKAGSAGTSVVSDLNGEITLVAGTNITLTGDNTAKTITIDSTGGSGSLALDDLTDVNVMSATNGQVLSYNSSLVRWEPVTISSGGLTNVVEDTTPQLGGNLDVNGNSIVSTSNGNIAITPNGTGSVVLDGLNWPQADGTSDQVLKTNGSGQLSWTTVSSGATTLDGLSDVSASTPSNGDVLTWNSTGSTWVSQAPSAPSLTLDNLTDVVATSPTNGQVLAYNNSLVRWEPVTMSTGITMLQDDTTPKLGGNLDVNGNMITSTGTNANIVLYPSTSGGQVISYGPTFSVGSGSASTIQSYSNSALTVTAGSSNLTLSGAKVVASSLNYNEGAIYDLGTTGGTIAPNVTNGNVQKITLNSALTMNAFTTPVAGQSLTLIIYGGTAYTSITSTMKFAGGVKTLTGTAGCIDILTVYYDGTNYFASLGKGFA